MRSKILNLNIAFGVLVAFVLVLGVQGTADAQHLEITKGAGDLQSKPRGNPFEITFSVTERSNTTTIKNTQKQLVDEDNNRINSSGYEVAQAPNGTVYRVIGTLLGPGNTEPSTLYRAKVTSDGADATNPISVTPTKEESGRNVYMTESSGIGSVIDGYARALYTDEARILRAKGTAVAKTLSKRYHYNEESVTITSTASNTVTGSMTFRLKGGLSPPSSSLILKEVPATNPNALQGDITLICTPPGGATGTNSEGTYTVTITDSTAGTDLRTAVTGTRNSITFTLYVTGPPGDNRAIAVRGTGTVPSPGTRPIRVDDQFTFTEATNEELHYQVTKGDGTLYVGTLDIQRTTPAQDLNTSVQSAVYLLMEGTTNEVTVSFIDQISATHGRRVVFEYTGTDRHRDDDDDDDDPPPPPPTNTIIISPASLSGAPGGTETITIANPAGVLVNLSGSGFTFSPQSGTATSFTSSVTLPSSTGTHTITAAGIIGGSTVSDTTSVTVTAPGTLTARQDGGTVIVTASPVPSSNLAFTLTSGAVRVGSGEILASGTGRAIPILAAGSHILTINAEGYNATQVSFTAGATTQQTTTTPTTTTPTTPTTLAGPAGVADSIEIADSRTLSGTVNASLRLRARVLDANDNGVSNVRVTFRVLSPGKGRLTQRGSGRAAIERTDRNGYATANLTPLGGNLIVEAKAAGVSAAVTFIINVSGAATTTPTTTTPTQPSRTIAPVVHVGASQRPPMLWVDGGKIYALVGANVQEFASGVEGAMNIAIGGGKVYWTEKTGESGGTINSANLNGSNVQELASILAVPMGIAVGSDKLYWTNSRGRIQSADLDGSGITNVIPSGLEGAMDIALAGGNAYWTQGGNVRFVNLRGQKQIRNISTGTDTAGSLAIGGGKVYWTEMTGTSSGTVNSANLNGANATELASIQAVPSGIAVDTARSKLYWTNSRGRVQSANLDGSKIQNVVSGLGHPGDMVLSNSITAPVASTTTPSTTTASKSKYDINGDGSVDSKDVDAIVVAVAAGLTDAKYDVNGDGKVDIFDVSAVSSNRNGGAASAPALVGNLNLSTVQIDRLQEQIELLIASNDRSPDAMRILVYLQQLIATARPEKTQLLANYPNPFNPETWIPYELADATQVKITIYNAQGVVIRTLQLGQQSAGYYTDRDRAAYWDGRNALGEQVASGIYFYQLETDEMSALRKMVILK